MEAQTFFEHFDVLVNSPNAVAKLREMILQLAVQGKLVAPALGTSRDEFPLGSLLREESLNGCSKAPNNSAPGVEVLRISAGTSRSDAIVDENDHKWVELPCDATEKFRLLPGDRLACRFNGNLHFVGRFSLYLGTSGRVQFNPDKLIRFRVDTTRCDPRYVRYAMNAEDTRKKIEVFCATTAGNLGISATNLKTVAIPVPPLADQQAIVAKVDQLMSLCDALEAKLKQSQADSDRLLAAAVHHLLDNQVNGQA